MNFFNARLRLLRSKITRPLLIKKRENLFYLLGQAPMTGWLLVNPLTPALSQKRRGRKKAGMIFFGDGLEKINYKHSNILQNVGMFLRGERRVLVEDVFSLAEADFLKTKLKSVKLGAVASPVDKLRQIKDSQELSYMRASGRIVEKVWAQVKRDLRKQSWTENQLVHRIADLGKSFGAESVSFEPIVASGANAAFPHHRPSNRPLRAGETIIIDFGFKHRGYCSDFTRTVFVKKAPARFEKIYRQVEKAYRAAFSFLSSSRERIWARGSGFQVLDSHRGVIHGPEHTNDRVVHASDLHKKAVAVLAETKLDKYFIHNLGHGCGLEIHERPSLSAVSKDILQNGMVFSLEPGVYVPKFGGVRIEDLVYLERSRINKFIKVPTKLEANIIR